MNELFLLLTHFLIFIGLYLFTFYPFGLLLIEKYRPKLKGHEKILLSLLLSTVGFVVLAFIAGVIRVRFVVLPIVVGANAYGLWKLGSRALMPWKELFRDKILIFLLFLAIIVQGVINFPSGYKYKEGLLFWSSQGNDGLWHVAVMEEIKKSMPPENPVYGGEKLYNYHYLNDIQMGEFGRIYPFLPSLDIFFRFFPVILSFLVNLSAFSFIYYWKKSRATGYWAILFTSLLGNFGYIVTLIRYHQLFSGETVFWAAQGNTILGNPPHAAAYGFLTGAFFCLAVFLRTKDRLFLWLSFILGAVLAGFKVSGGAVLIAGLFLAGAVDLLVNKKRSLIFLGLGLALTNFAVLKLMTKGAMSFLVFEPWWFVRTTITVGDRVGWIDLELRRQFYLDRGGWRSILRIIEYETIAFVIFVVGNIGTKIIGLYVPFKKGLKGLKDFFADMLNLILLGILISSLGIVLLFVQRGIAYNLIQFMQYFILAFGFFAAVSVYEISKKIKSPLVKVLLATALIAVSIPTVIGNIVDFYGRGRTAPSVIDNEEIEALDYLRDNSPTDALVLTTPFDENAHWGFKAQPWPISVWYSTGYVSAISSRRTYFANEGQSDILGLPIKERRKGVLEFFAGEDINSGKQFLNNNDISYIYLIKRELRRPMDTGSLGLDIFFENDEVIIYKVI